jgi:uncharacterized protein (TIGR03437 family)
MVGLLLSPQAGANPPSRRLSSFDGLRSPYFEASAGRGGKDVTFLLQTREFLVSLGPRGMVISDVKPDGARHEIRMDLVHRSPLMRVEGLDRLPGNVNYLIGGDRSRWITNVPRYRSVAYRDVYPGIDLIFHLASGEVEYDWRLSPGADPAAIRLVFHGVDRLKVGAGGELVAGTRDRTLISRKPVAFQAASGQQRPVTVSYRLISGREAGVASSYYDERQPLTIDPVLNYSTEFGGSGTRSGRYDTLLLDQGNSIAADSAGNAYVTGVAYSQDFPSIDSGLRPVAQTTNCFEAKLDASGAVVYLSFVGPASGCSGAASSTGEAYVAGNAGGDFPLVNPLPMSSPQGTSGPFLAKLSADGASILYSDILAGETSVGFAVGVAADVYVTGLTNSPSTFTTTPGAIRLIPPSAQQSIFVDRISADGSKLVYSALLGGSGSLNEPAAIQADSGGSAYVAGMTNSSDFPTTPGGVQTSTPGEGFVSKLSSDGSALTYSTYVWSAGGGGIEALAVDAAGNAYLAGYAVPGFPTTPGAFQTTATFDSFGLKGFVTKLDASGTSVVYSTFLGGSAEENISGIVVDASGNVYVTGETNSTDFPLLNPLQGQIGGGTCEAFYMGPLISCFDAFVTKLNADGSGLLFSTYLGGSGADTGYGIAAANGDIYITGQTLSTDFPYSGSGNHPGGAVFVASISEAGNAPVFTPLSVTSGASFVTGMTPGGIATIFGQNLTSVSGVSMSGSELTSQLNGTSVNVNGLPAPLFAVASSGSAQQINFQVPWEIGYASTAQVTVVNNGVDSLSVTVPVSLAQPGLFTSDGVHVSAEHGSDSSPITALNPAVAGETVVLFGTGLGPVVPPVGSGLGAPSKPPATTLITPSVLVGGLPALVTFSGMTPGFVGLYQLNVVLPLETPSGDVDVAVADGESAAKVVKLPVK